ncbi:MAG: DUF2520 domain-containing protein [Bacteroidales bacterium]|nr:DUF2520 domain-containing protein [Bacteroidales bacterium]MBN2755714.1 DUF2520 domain-containing protein [Bacteroidales bacterium]
MKKKDLNIVLIGAGNVASHLSIELLNTGCNILQIYSRNIDSAKELAQKTNSDYTNNLNLLNKNADLYIVSITDNAIKGIIQHPDFKTDNIVHTAGSVGIEVFKTHSENYGVFYPFQTFSKGKNINFKEIPICIEASNKNFEDFLFNLANKISNKVYKMNSEQRKYLHLSGVFASNFANHMFYIASNILQEQNIDNKILNPLIQETANKLLQLSAFDAQTGPAVRNDTESIKKHLDLLSSKPEFIQIYKLISEDIYKKHF